ncbi:hypothetical protein R3I93_008391 [Phoxinus phoxinus]|uniref:Uncharacterized protein n=1 Tax=Phoxinus phoxinus TaxID=58324 RepID=A0AAN9D6K8_9TELE
MDKVVFVITL